MALFFGILGLALSLVSRLKLWPLASACCWVMVEFGYSRAPFGGFGWTRIAISAGRIVVLLLGGTALRSYQPEPEVPIAGTVNVGVVQGNVPGRGIEALGRARSVTNNHLSETVDLMAKARLGRVPMPDFILWPENSTDIDPQLD